MQECLWVATSFSSFSSLCKIISAPVKAEQFEFPLKLIVTFYWFCC